MIKTLIKHKIAEIAIDNLFNKVTKEFGVLKIDINSIAVGNYYSMIRFYGYCHETEIELVTYNTTITEIYTNLTGQAAFNCKSKYVECNIIKPKPNRFHLIDYESIGFLFSEIQEIHA